MSILCTSYRKHNSLLIFKKKWVGLVEILLRATTTSHASHNGVDKDRVEMLSPCCDTPTV
jgi:hypothetical protein